MTSDEQALVAFLDSWGKVADWSLVIVLIGAVVAFVAEVGGWIKDDKWKRRINKMAAVLTILGTAIGLSAQHQLGSYSGRLIALIQRDAAMAMERAGALGVTTDRLSAFVNNKTAETDSAIASLSAATAEAKRKLADVLDKQEARHLNPEQRKTMRSLVRPGAYVVVEYLATGEPQDFATEIGDILYDLDVEVQVSPRVLQPDKRHGLLVSYDHKYGPAKSVFDALKKASLRPVEGPPQKIAHSVMITVAPK